MHILVHMAKNADTRIARGVRMESSLWRFLDRLAKKTKSNASAEIARLVREKMQAGR